MATYYVSFTGSNANSGTSRDFPWLTLAYAATQMTNGDELCLMSGRFGRTAADVFVSSASVTLYADSTWNAIISAGRVMDPGLFTDGLGDAWIYNIGTGKTVKAVLSLWGLRFTGLRRNSDMTLVASYLLVQSTVNSYYYDTVLGLLYCNFGAGANPSTDPDFLSYPPEWIEGGTGINSFIAISADNARVIGVQVENIRGNEGTDGNSCGVVISGQNGLVQGCRSYHMAQHAFICAGGANNTNFVVEDCTCWGLGAIVGGSCIGAYSSGTNLSGIRFRRNALHLYAALNVAGSPVTSTDLDGFIHHTDAVKTVDDIAYNDNTVTQYENAGSAFICGNVNTSLIPAADSVAELRASSWPARYINNSLRNGWGMSMMDGASFAKCNIQFTNEITGGGVKGTFSLPLGPAPTFSPVVARMNFEASHLTFNLFHSTVRSMFHLRRATGAASRLIGVNSNFIDKSVGTPNWNRFCTWEGADDVGQHRMYGCVFSGQNAKALTFNYGDDTMSNSRFQYVGCQYHNIENVAPGYWSQDADRQTKALWQSAVDAVLPGRYDQDPDWVDPLVDATPQPGGDIATTKVVQSVRPSQGINNGDYNGHYGAWQDGVSGSSDLSRRLLLLLS